MAYSYLRFSDPKQRFGDSERRQLAYNETYCRARNLTLSAETFADRGVSTSYGRHRKKALGRLLEVVKPGQAILIETVNRWSRELELDSRLWLRDTVRRDIEVHFTALNFAVTKENFDSPNVANILFMLAQMAHEEILQ
jgi:DNA invertase Pin-like site-specific DNA recombinase